MFSLFLCTEGGCTVRQGPSRVPAAKFGESVEGAHRQQHGQCGWKPQGTECSVRGLVGGGGPCERTAGGEGSLLAGFELT